MNGRTPISVKAFNHDGRSPVPDLNTGPHEYEAVVIMIRT